MTVSAEPDGRVSFRVLIGADSWPSAGNDLLELIISLEDLSRALAGRHADAIDQVSAFPCHIGFCSNTPSTAA